MDHSETPQSYFQSALANRARLDEYAAPVQINELEQRLGYLSPNQIRAVRQACLFADEAHDGQKRQTGHSYITHPLAVADILASMQMDHQCIIAALLHDVLEDTEVNKTRLTKRFGPDVAEIVDGVSKLSKIIGDAEQARAEYYQKFVMATARDLRVIMVKLADRLHNMRTLGVMPIAKRKRIAHETLDLYAPIANRLGIHNVKTELEDLAFEALYPVRSDHLRDAVDKVHHRNRTSVAQTQRDIQACLDNENIKARVEFHTKHLYSIYLKMKKDRKRFADIMDVFGFLIVTDSVDDCYRALGAVHTLYTPKIEHFRDYIAIPKANGYQSLHTAIVGPHAIPIELQIRTKSMDSMAKYGIASQGLYRTSLSSRDGSTHSATRAQAWIQKVLDIQKRAGNPQEFLESLKSDLFSDEVYVFTPGGHVIELPRGASVVDFAYAIHTDIGNTCGGCTIDKVSESLSAQLQSGQTVDIQTDENARPSPEWLKFVVTAKARTAIRDFLNAQQETDSIKLGTELLDMSLTNVGTSVQKLDFRRLRKVFRHFEVRNRNELLAMIGAGQVSASIVAQRLLDEDKGEYAAINIVNAGPLVVHGGEGQVISYGRCCGPVPGDEIKCFATPNQGLVVHRKGCRNAVNSSPRTTNVTVNWSDATVGDFDTRLRAVVQRRKGVLAELAKVLNESNAGIDRLHIDERSVNQSSVTVALSVTDLKHLRRILLNLRRSSSVETVSRVAG